MTAVPDTPADTATPAAPATRRPFRSWPRAARWSTYVAAVLVLVLVAGLVTAVVTVRRSLPQTDGEVEVPGLGAKVEVVRDDHGIPQVYASSSDDLFYAQGYVQAQDRFFEMDFRRHVTSGRLSELLGKDALEADMYIRTMGWRRVAEQELSLLSPETLSYLEAFSAGVNAYMDSHTPSQMSLEYSLLALNGLDYAPEEWTPADSVAWLKAMAWDLRGNMEEEIQRALMTVNHSAEEIASLYPAYPFERHQPIVTQGAVVDGVFEQDASGSDTRKPARPALPTAVTDSLERLGAGLERMPEMLGHGKGIGSNAWAVDGEHSTTGKPILANDPHLGTSMPGIWYQMGLHCTELSEACPFDTTGFTFAGVPGVVIGHNQQIAWGFSNLGPDVVDLYLEKLDGKLYEYDGGKRPLATREEIIEVLGEDEPFTFTVRSTKHGPLLSDVSAQLSTVGANAHVQGPAPERGNGYAVALSWTALTPNRTADAIFEIDKATNWDEFRAATRDFAAPSQNMVYADRAGHIGYQAPGLIPIRKSGNAGAYPAEGWVAANDWTGNYVPFDALPSVLDPEDGLVATANQAVIDGDYPYYLGDSWSYGYRSQRIRDVLEEKGRLGVEDMTRLQLDTSNEFAPTFVPYLLDILLPSPYLAAGQRLLKGWDHTQPTDSAAAAYYNAVWDRTLELTFHDQMQQSVWPTGNDRWFEVMRRLLEEPYSPWWDNADTETVVETRDDILYQAMTSARDELVRRQARRAVDWTWGHQHQMDLESQTLGQSDLAVVRWLFNRGGYEVPGGGDLVNATKWDAAAEDYDVTAAPSMRMVVSLADLDDSRWVSLSGVSGHAFSRHYSDQTDLWVAGETLPWYFSRDRLEENGEDTLTLVPAAGG
ncbi:penicillin acylase family protein [Nocardioides sp. WL0053]|uniref:Penicillin acylase family protein n=1 Tax=Nocardioides jiangsuensis TaxID=2866161 RepID=A0ABS7RJF7_9ACTN|nr:penicillin acylase family protein [Nocardioides jiangsuensis]